MNRQLFCFFQFNGDNKSFCNQTCPYCYGGEKEMKHYWNGDIEGWEKAFERLNRDIYFVMSYGETFGSKGFYECVGMIGKHPTWTLCIVTNLSYDVSRLLRTKLAKEKRVFIIACWHPLGVADRRKAWVKFTENLLKLKKQEVPVHVMFLWYKPQIPMFKEYFWWLDSHDFRVNIRRFVGNIGGFKIPFTHKVIGGRNYPEGYSEQENAFLRLSSNEKLNFYCNLLNSPRGKPCLASRDLILVKYNGEVGLCADCPTFKLGNIFDLNFKLGSKPVLCPSDVCGGYYGMLHLIDNRFGLLPERLENDTFVSIQEGLEQSSPVQYRNREEMLKCLGKL